MVSSEKEEIDFLSIIDTMAANGNVDEWLILVEAAMIDSIRDNIRKAFDAYPKIPRTKWVLDRCGQAVLCISMTYWTYETEAAI